MNVVFWLLVILIAAGIWFAISPSFERIGEHAISIVRNAKDEMLKDESKEEEK